MFYKYMCVCVCVFMCLYDVSIYIFIYIDKLTLQKVARVKSGAPEISPREVNIEFICFINIYMCVCVCVCVYVFL